MIHIEQFIVNPFQENCSLVWDNDGHCAVVDPGYVDAERNDIVAFIEAKNLKPVCILKTILEQCIENEDKHHPLTDENLMDILNQKGYRIARRTVAKYREMLDIPVARMRKQI